MATVLSRGKKWAHWWSSTSGKMGYLCQTVK